MVVRGYYLFRESNSCRERSSRATVSSEEQIMSKDNYSCIFQKPKLVYCLYYPSNISAHSESSVAKTRQNKTRSKTRRLLGVFWHCFLKKFPNFLTRNWRKTFHFEVCARALPADNVRSRADVIGSRVTILPITREKKYLMDYNKF